MPRDEYEPLKNEEREKGAKVRDLRRVAHISLRQLAEKLGIDVTTMSDVELGRADVDDWDELYETINKTKGT